MTKQTYYHDKPVYTSTNLSSLAMHLWDMEDALLKHTGRTVMILENARELRDKGRFDVEEQSAKWRATVQQNAHTLAEAYALYLERLMLWKEDRREQGLDTK